MRFFLISLLLLETQSSCSLSKGEPVPVGEVILQLFWTKLCPFFDLEFSKCSYSRALAPACGALVTVVCLLANANRNGIFFTELIKELVNF